MSNSIVHKLKQPLTMSKFLNTRDLYREQEEQRAEAANYIDTLTARVKE